MLISRQDDEALYYLIFRDEKPDEASGSEQESNTVQQQ
jgi:hypothetical protein